MTQAPGSKHDKDDFCEFIYCVQHTFTLLSHECYFSRTCIILCLGRLNVHYMCGYAIVCVCFFVYVCVGVNVCALLVHVHVCPSASECVCVCMCMFV